MQRIGFAASKMSKGSLLSYNLYVFLISWLLSVLIFFICGFSILLVILLISWIVHTLKPVDLHAGWVHMFKICLIVLAVVVGVFNTIAILRNIQFTKNKI